MVKKEVEFIPNYPLRYNWNGIEALTIALDAPAFMDIDRVINPKNLGPVQIKLMLWAGLIHKYPDLQKEKVPELIDIFLETHCMKDLSLVISNALMASGLLGSNGTGADTGEVSKQLKN